MAGGSAGADAPSERTAADLARVLDVVFDDLSILERALIHRSWSFENGGVPHNERIEFLGDAVLAIVVTDELYRSEPDRPEGDLAKIRSAAVKEETLADVARSFDLGSWIRLGVGEAASGGADKDSILGDTLEAVIGAVYLDQGLTVADEVIHRLFDGQLNALRLPGHAALEPKTALQELASSRFGTVPIYEVTGTGPDHEPVYEAVVIIDGQRLGTGTGTSKKRAERAAAEQAWEALHRDR
jgi:ribonuclease-3